MHEFARLGRQSLWALVAAMTSMSVMAREPLEFNVATYNLRLNTPEDGVNAWPLRKQAVKELIVRGTKAGLLPGPPDVEFLSES